MSWFVWSLCYLFVGSIAAAVSMVISDDVNFEGKSADEKQSLARVLMVIILLWPAFVAMVLAIFIARMFSSSIKKGKETS